MWCRSGAASGRGCAIAAVVMAVIAAAVWWSNSTEARAMMPGSGGGDLTVDQVATWVATEPDGGVRNPGARCPAWARVLDDPDEPVWDGLINTRVESDGVIAWLWFRDCGTVRQFVWIRQESPTLLAATAMNDLQSRMLPAPQLLVSPASRMVVNLETWLAVADPGPVSVTAAIPGLSVMLTAQVHSTVFTVSTGDTPTVQIDCDGLGDRWAPGAQARAPLCGYTPIATHPDGATISAALRWVGRWSSSSGDGGELGPITGRSSEIDLPTTEIATIGRR